MTSRSLPAIVALVVVLGLAAGSMAQQKAGTAKARRGAKAGASQGKAEDTPKDKGEGETKGKDTDKAKDKAEVKTETATFGGGCFWCSEAVFERVPGVKSVVSGYAGGNVPNPTYDMVCTGLTGHAEVVQVEFDPEKVSFERLIKIFFASHDPTTLNSQGPDFGTQYRSIIFFRTDAQKDAALKVYRELTASHAFPDPIVTQLVPFTAFHPADRHHQDYFRNNRDSDYAQMYIVPKVEKLKHLKIK